MGAAHMMAGTTVVGPTFPGFAFTTVARIWPVLLSGHPPNGASCSRRCCTSRPLADQPEPALPASHRHRLGTETTSGDGFGVGWYDARRS
jgi:hypothetical protein